MTGVFLKTMGEACERTDWKVHTWVLMGNHYHLLLKTPEPNLVTGMQWLQKWLAAELHLRSAANASQQIRRHRLHPPKLPTAMHRWIIQSRNVA